MAKRDDVELDLPDVAANVADDDVFLDFSDVEESTGFTVLNAGWYPMVITGWKEFTVTKPGGKLAVGTKGTQFEFTVADGHPNAKRKVWNTYWHAKENLSYLKGVLSVCGQFTSEQLSGGLSYDDIRSGAIGGELMVRLTVRPGNDQYGPSNTVAQVKAFDPELAATMAANSDLPG